MHGSAIRQARNSRAIAAALPHDGFAGHDDAEDFGASPRPRGQHERLAWPVAASAILGASATLWLGIVALGRLIFG